MFDVAWMVRDGNSNRGAVRSCDECERLRGLSSLVVTNYRELGDPGSVLV